MRLLRTAAVLVVECGDKAATEAICKAHELARVHCLTELPPIHWWPSDVFCVSAGQTSHLFDAKALNDH